MHCGDSTQLQYQMAHLRRSFPIFFDYTSEAVKQDFSESTVYSYLHFSLVQRTPELEMTMFSASTGDFLLAESHT